MCSIYKKNDKRDIANYRLITVLNSGYKMFTKAFTARLSKVTGYLIHNDQAGFISGRSIFDQIKRTKLLIDYAELVEEDGLIIALDQEKAYDKITHDYLWKILEKTEIPPQFTEIIKSLYKTVIIINGVISPAYNIKRGVCQGDPLSCLLFDLAIEPLAEMLRRSDLEGYRVSGTTKKLITSLFADDTTVYLTAKDKFSDLQDILETWCTASGAKFNIAKTEVIPISTQEYRLSVIQTRKAHETHEAISDHIHIAGEGEPVRILGAWIENNIDPNE